MASSWNESLETGNVFIDRQHYQLINLLDELKGDLPLSSLLRMLDNLMNFTIEHFLSEEELMAEVNYPPDATKTMVDQHKEFKTYMRLRVLEFRRAKTFNITPFQSFVTNHLIVHEFGLDRQLANWITRQDKTSRAA